MFQSKINNHNQNFFNKKHKLSKQLKNQILKLINFLKRKIHSKKNYNKIMTPIKFHLTSEKQKTTG